MLASEWRGDSPRRMMMISCNAACLSLAVLDVSIRALASHRALRPPPSVTSQRPQPHFSHLTTTIGQLSAPMSPRPSRRLTWFHRARDHQQPAAAAPAVSCSGGTPRQTAPVISSMLFRPLEPASHVVFHMQTILMENAARNRVGYRTRLLSMCSGTARGGGEKALS